MEKYFDKPPHLLNENNLCTMPPKCWIEEAEQFIKLISTEKIDDTITYAQKLNGSKSKNDT
ncbi:hypothetical protein A3Q56_08456 [Intoshia linei]|uniref:Uncharacterized protein n=1 Tax=Intoshia linei TaxID=1819745 RepID=A0A177AP93_9BILA|nr:hypothetical protein A3Q56_08456 [Intoshia linei]